MAKGTNGRAIGAGTRTDAELLKLAALDAKEPQAVIRKRIEASIAYLNRLAAQRDALKSTMASHVFLELLGGDPAIAFAPEHEQPAIYLLLKRRCGDTLKLRRDALSRAIRIAALDKVVREDAWRNLPWREKVALLPLVRSLKDLKPLRAGVKQALRMNFGPDEIREWIAVHHPRKDSDSDAAQSGPTIATGRRIVRQAAPLADPSMRAVMVRRIAEADDDVREELLEQYRRLARDAAEFVREVEEYEKE